MIQQTISSLILVLVYIHGTTGEIEAPPANTIVLNNAELVINCTSNDTTFNFISWDKIYANGTTIALAGCSIGTIPDPYRFVGFDNTCELHVDNTTYDEAEIHQCRVDGPVTLFASSTVVVLGSEPVLNILDEKENYTTNENVTLQFVVQYRGGMTPELDWKPPDEIVTLNITSDPIPGQISYAINITSNTAKSFNLTCDILFTVGTVVVTDPRNVSYTSNSYVTVQFVPAENTTLIVEDGTSPWVYVGIAAACVVGTCGLVGVGYVAYKKIKGDNSGSKSTSVTNGQTPESPGTEEQQANNTEAQPSSTAGEESNQNEAN